MCVVKICYQLKNYDALNENVLLLSKRRSQLKQVNFLFFYYFKEKLRNITRKPLLIIILENCYDFRPIYRELIFCLTYFLSIFETTVVYVIGNRLTTLYIGSPDHIIINWVIFGIFSYFRCHFLSKSFL